MGDGMRIAAVIIALNEGNAGCVRDENQNIVEGQFADPLSEKYNGNEIRATCHSLQEHTSTPLDIIVVDDESTDGGCDGLEGDGITVVRNGKRRGIARSRQMGVDACGSDVDIVAFYDAHQRLTPGCLDHCATLAQQYQSIVWPDVRGFADHGWTGHGAFGNTFRNRRKDGSYKRYDDRKRYFKSQWNNKTPRDKISRVTGLVVPGYVMPISLFDKLRFSDFHQGWGASEPALWVRAWACDIDILHTCGTEKQQALSRHMFRHKPNGYRLQKHEIFRNHAIIAKSVFSEWTWENYWLPQVFDVKHLDAESRKMLNSKAFMEERERFQQFKTRPDEEFWLGYCREALPWEDSE